MGHLDKLDLTKQYGKDEYEKKLERLQLRLLTLQRALRDAARPLIIGFEGWDAAGKGGAILRLTQRLDPRGYSVHAVGAPTAEEKQYHYLHRFWRDLPPRGNLGIFDRTWYGRVLVERIEGFATTEEWSRAYDELNQFERLLTRDGAIIVKFWLHISAQEQLRRFEERQANPYKRWKITDEDWRNREKRAAYADAVEDMLDRTDTKYAPWTLVEAEHKWYARVRVLEAVVKAVENGLDD